MEGEAEPPSPSGLCGLHFRLLILLHQQLRLMAGNMATDTSSSKMPKDAGDSCKNVVASDGPSSSPQRSGFPGDGYVCLGWREPIFWSHRLLMPWSALPFSAPSQLPAGFSTWVSEGSSGASPPSPPFQGLQVPSRAQTRWENSQMWGSNTRCLR